MSMLSTLTYVYAPCLQTCCLADFQIRKRPNKGRSADWEVGDTAGLETCVTSSYLRPPALSQRECFGFARPKVFGSSEPSQRRHGADPNETRKLKMKCQKFLRDGLGNQNFAEKFLE